MDQSFISSHRAPHAGVRRLVAWLLGAGIILTCLALLVQIGLIVVGGPFRLLTCGSAFLTAVLLIPLLLRVVLHPEVDITANSLLLRPYFLPPQHIQSNHLARLIPHPFVYNDEATGRLLHGKKYHPRQGVVVLVSPTAGLHPLYRLVGSVAGAGNTPGFAISSTTHKDYEILLDAIQRAIPANSTP